MYHPVQIISARSGVAAIMLIGVCACTTEFADPSDDHQGVGLDLGGLAEGAGGRAGPGGGGGRADFNGDGYDDLAIGVPGEGVGSNLPSVGAVNVLYGSALGLSATGNQLWHQNSAGILGAAEPGDSFGASVAAGDFDGDGFADLAIGVPFESIGAVADGGAVNVLYGSAKGLTAAGNQIWHQNSAGLIGAAEPSDLFGWALTSGDFNKDGYQDLAVGVPGEDVGGVADAGAVNVIYGSAAGLSATSNQIWHQDVAGVGGVAETGDSFGSALAAGDFNSDGHVDLAIGVPDEDVALIARAGMVNVFYGSSVGLSADGDQIWHQNSLGILGAAEPNDNFGRALAAGDFDNDGYPDLAIGVPNEGVGLTSEAGALNVIYGSAVGLSVAADQLWHQDSLGILGVAEASDHFGRSLAAGDFDDDGRDDLAIGVPGEDLEGTAVEVDAGALNLIYGSDGGLAAVDNQLWHQNSGGIPGATEGFDAFGSSLTAGDFDADGRMDLVIGVPLEDLGPLVNAGAANVLYGAIGGLTAIDSQIWHQDSSGMIGAGEPGDRFGASVR
ncbi:putative integrin-like protein [Enhygromyxa salina]|uniref:Putative integrin-like protein n=1 Tax=Enhygromyxa salina TaxID=215803 RepID=A0A0C2D0I9_9BACT|nr:FG-GAP-like repeat-containing protein [Enhygromyxa salina]KIG15360.1 putative integrin-like protein [Enhygromyxa salina]